MRYHDIKKCDLLNGAGIRLTLFVAGCNHHCKNCQNPITWDPNGGLLFDDEAKYELLVELQKPYYRGVTFSGGDPLYPDNREDITALAKEIKEKYPDRDIWVYTGFTYEEVKDLEIMKYVDVLVDGKYIEELASVPYPWAGSTNQRVIDVKETRKDGTVRKYKTF
jgi:anaerobic ribonucleoside-triphosphate reductase activating protein